VTFNQYGRDFPMGGMNEKGLVVELMWLDGTRYPDPDDRPETGVLEWIQMQLDLRDSVADVLAHLNDVRIAGSAPLHYLVADPAGSAATVEFLDGRPVVHTGDTLPVPALANDTYASSLAWLRSGGARGSGTGAAWTGGSRDRFGRAARLMEAQRAGDAPLVPAAFEILSAVAQGRATRWSIVYDMPRRAVSFRTSRHAPIRSLALEGLDLACGGPVLMLADINAPLSGDIRPDLVPWTAGANLDLVSGSYRQVSFLRNTPREEIEAVAAQPLSSVCATGPS
jgi:choloylglycine hydrolase